MVAFFQISELSLIPFVAKLAKTYIFDSTKKYQINYTKIDAVTISIKEAASKEKTQVIDYKIYADVDPKMLEGIMKGGLLG